MREAKRRKMAEIVNLRRARKAKARAGAAREADENRIRHGSGKASAKLAKARAAKNTLDVDAHKLDDDDEVQ
jgi:hypothetical protein